MQFLLGGEAHCVLMLSPPPTLSENPLSCQLESGKAGGGWEEDRSAGGSPSECVNSLHSSS